MRRRTVRILAGLAIGAVTLACAYAAAVGIAAWRLDQAYAALERDGRPMSMADFDRANTPSEQNAACLYEGAMLLLQGRPAGQRDLLRRLSTLSERYVREDLDPNEQAELRQSMQLDVVGHALAAIREGVTRSVCRFPDWYDENGTPLAPYLGRLRELTFILAAKAALEAEDGRIEEAWSTATTELRFADALRTDQPYALSQLVRASLICVACRTARTLCDTSIPSEQQYEALNAIIKDLDDTGPLRLTADADRLLGERDFDRGTFWQGHWDRIFGQRYNPGKLLCLLVYRLKLKPLILADHAAYLRLTHAYAKILERPYDPNEANPFDKVYDEIVPGHPLTASIDPSIGILRERYLGMITETRVTRVGLALLRYRERHGAFPQSLDALGLDYAVDPFTLKPLLYRPESSGFALYSLGPDRKDNGGIPRPLKGDAEYDLVWRFPSR
jgi:hypothetical protein